MSNRAASEDTGSPVPDTTAAPESAAQAPSTSTGASESTRSTTTTTVATPGAGESASTTTTTTTGPGVNESATTTTAPTAAQPTIQPQPVEPMYVDNEDQDKMRGLTAMAGGGVEGYTGDLASQVNPGPGWGVTAAIKPTKILGIEIAYSGAVNQLKGNGVAGLQGRSADIVRNGVEARATLALSATPVQPYIMGGFGVSHYSVRDDLRAVGFQSDTSERVPLGGGLRAHFGQFTADARFAYNFLINEGFATLVNPDTVAGVSSVSAGAYQGLLQFGATF